MCPVPRVIKDNRIVFGSLLREMASMSILDDAIREHLELKRAHGADESELKKLEDEAFGPPQRPDEVDPLAEAPTQFLGAPEGAEASSPEALQESGSRSVPSIADLQEPPPAPAEAEPADASQQAREEPKPEAPQPDAQTPPEPEPEPSASAEPVADSGPNTEERHAIAEQPTEFFDVEAEIGPPADPQVEAPAANGEEEEEGDDFFSEQRLSDELNQALEAPLTEEHELERDEELEEGEEEEDEEPDEPERPPESQGEHEDVLEDTPDFLEDAPEDDELWFEQRPPKDFDFDD